MKICVGIHFQPSFVATSAAHLDKTSAAFDFEGAFAPLEERVMDLFDFAVLKKRFVNTPATSPYLNTPFDVSPSPFASLAFWNSEKESLPTFSNTTVRIPLPAQVPEINSEQLIRNLFKLPEAFK